MTPRKMVDARAADLLSSSYLVITASSTVDDHAPLRLHRSKAVKAASLALSDILILYFYRMAEQIVCGFHSLFAGGL